MQSYRGWANRPRDRHELYGSVARAGGRIKAAEAGDLSRPADLDCNDLLFDLPSRVVSNAIECGRDYRRVASAVFGSPRRADLRARAFGEPEALAPGRLARPCHRCNCASAEATAESPCEGWAAVRAGEAVLDPAREEHQSLVTSPGRLAL